MFSGNVRRNFSDFHHNTEGTCVFLIVVGGTGLGSKPLIATLPIKVACCATHTVGSDRY